MTIPPFILHLPGRGPMSGEVVERDAAMARWQRQVDLLGGIPYKADEYDVAVTDDHVIQLANVTAEVGGKTFTYSTCNYSSAVLTELPRLSTVGILGGCSFDRPLVDLSTNRVAE